MSCRSHIRTLAVVGFVVESVVVVVGGVLPELMRRGLGCLEEIIDILFEFFILMLLPIRYCWRPCLCWNLMGL